MRGRCEVTGLPYDRCDCGGCPPDDDRDESWRTVPFASPEPDAA